MKALQTAKYLEWRNRLSMGSDNGDDVETSKRGIEALHAIPRLVLIATMMQQKNCDKKTWMERLVFVEKGLSKPRAQP